MNKRFWKRISLKRWHKIILTIVVFFILLLSILPTIAKWYINKHGEDIIGRQISISKLHINYFKFSVNIKEFVMYEKNGIDKFVSFDNLCVNFAPWHLLSSEYALTEFTLTNPYVSIIYSEEGFNFDDIIESSDTTDLEELEDTTSNPTKYLIRNLNLIGGYITYQDKTSNSTSEIKHLGISVPEIAWDNSKSELGIDFILGEKGKVSLGGDINQVAGTYMIHAKTEDIDISPFAPYLNEYIIASSINGLLYTDLIVNGEMEEPINVIVTGKAGIKEFAINDIDDNHFLSFADLCIILDSLNIGNGNYCIDTVSIQSPKLTAILDNNGSNFERLLEPYFSDTLDVSENTTETDTSTTEMHYSIKILEINDCAVAFSDLTLNRPFDFDITNLDFTMKDYSDLAKDVKMNFAMILNNTGSFIGNAIVDMLTLETFSFDGEIANLDMVSLSPYSEYFIARPITKGTFNYNVKLAMNPDYLDNQNAIKIVNLETGKKTKDTTAYKVPVGFALYILKDRNNLINIDLPVTGNPSDPSFKLGKIIWKTLEEFLIKTATSPAKAIGNVFGTNPESIRKISFEMLQDSLLKKQKNNLDIISEIIIKKPELIFTFSQSTNREEEMKLLAIQEAKKQFVSNQLALDSTALNTHEVVSKLQNDNVEFRYWLGMTDSTTMEQFPDFCMQKVGSNQAMALLNELMLKRENLLLNYFIDQDVPKTSVRFKMADLRNLPEEMKTPMFSIEVSMN